ncbi:hypothetical protein [Aliivibrio logei]|uniref:Uncharacterized protein n=1 Tax=Aliivibrio logei 5S-186 TaxID=626086 RepID=A0ABX3AZ80_ALILO|nr:hypothetical protein [Aliivibrio logei]OEF18911.1 hypothetical protein A1Q5_05270 [Aliivibrio logei 5S-186]
MKNSNCVLSLTLLFFAFNVNSKVLELTKDENSKLEEIKGDFDYSPMVMDLNNISSEIYSLNSTKEELRNLEIRLKEKKTSFGDKLNQSFSNNEPESVSDKYYNEMKKFNVSIKENSQEIEALNSKIDTIKNNKSTLNETIKDVKLKRNSKLLVLKNKVRKRYINELKIPIMLSKSGSIICTIKDMDECLSQNENNIISAMLLSSGYTNVKNKKFTVNNATMNYSGMLNYDVNVEFVDYYDKNTDAYLNDLFESSNFKLILRSNLSDVNYIVDGLSIGRGKVLSTTINGGKHEVLAIYKSNKKIANINVIKDSDFTFNFVNN